MVADTGVLLTIRNGQSCVVTVPPSVEPTTLTFRLKVIRNRLTPIVDGPKGMTVEYRKAVLSLTERQKPA